MGGYGDIQMIDENGIRMDGRKAGDLRPIEIETGVIPVADGSARVIWGNNHAVAAIYGPWRPIHERFSAKIELFWMYVTTWHHFQPLTGFVPDLTDAAERLAKLLLRH